MQEENYKYSCSLLSPQPSPPPDFHCCLRHGQLLCLPPLLVVAPLAHSIE